MLNPEILRRYKTKQDFDREDEEFEYNKRMREMQERQGQLQIQQAEQALATPKVQPFKLKQMAELALFKQNLGQPLTPDEQAAIQTMGQIAPPVYTTDALGRTITQPGGWSNVLKRRPADVMAMPPRQVMDTMGRQPTSAPQQQQILPPELPQQQADAVNQIGQIMADDAADIMEQPIDWTQQGQPQTMAQVALPTLDSEIAQSPYGRKEIFSQQAKGYDPNLPLKREELKLRKAEMQSKEDKKKSAQARVTANLNAIAQSYRNLEQMGGVISSRQDALENLGVFARTSRLGQATGRALGSEEQAIRDEINQIRPTLVNDIRQASEMGAKGMDSEKELEFFLQAATSPDRDIRTNIAAIKVLNDAYGLGASMNASSEKIKDLRQEFNQLVKGEGQKKRVRYNPITGRLE